MSMEATTTDPMYTTELYKSVAVNETSMMGMKIPVRNSRMQRRTEKPGKLDPERMP